MTSTPIATGKVEYLCIDGGSVDAIDFAFDGPVGDLHAGARRVLSGHDGAYIRTPALNPGDTAFNWRTWTGLAAEETAEVEQVLGLVIPQGCLLENFALSGVPAFSQLLPTSRLVFPRRDAEIGAQAILAIWERNGPCRGVGERLERHYGQPGLTTQFIAAAQQRRGVMGFRLAPGRIFAGDAVQVFPPTK